MRRKSILALAATCIVAAGAIPAAASSGTAASTHTVVLKSFRFHPGTLTIHRGDKVMWQWRDGEIEHNVTFHGFHSRTQGSGSYTVRFTRTGTYSYHCTIHVAEGMVGKIIVH
jgi:plastocyanin